MKKTLLLAALAALLGAGRAHAYSAPYTPQTYVSVSTFMPGAAGAKLWAFQNTSTTLDVRVLKLEVTGFSTGTVTGGLIQFRVYGSTAITHGGTSQVGFYDAQSALASAPSYVTVSTGPVNVALESPWPILRPLFVNNDEAATANLSDGYTGWTPADAGELILLHNTQRGIVLEQRNMAATNIADGPLFVRVVYTVK